MRSIVLWLAAIVMWPYSPVHTQGLGDVSGIAVSGNTLVLSVGSDTVVVTACTRSIVRVNYRPQGIEDPDTLVVMNRSWDQTAAVIDTTSGVLSVTSVDYRFEIDRSPLRFRLYSSKALLCSEPPGGGIQQHAVSFLTSATEFYGIHNRSQGSLYTRTGGAITAGNQGQAGGPFAWTRDGWGFLADADGGTITISGGTFSFSRPSNPAKRDMEFYFIVGQPKQILGGLHEITGFPPLFPKYAYGFMNSEWGIDQAELYQDLRTYRERKIPIDAYILDFDWMDWGWDDYGEFRWGPKFLDGESGALVDTLKKYSYHLMGIRKPRVHLNTVQGTYCQSNNLFVDYQTDYFSGKQVGRLNFHDPLARAWYWESFALRHRSYDKGITGYWNDEADEYGGNLMFMQMQRAQYEGQRALNNNRVWSINRNFYTGAQRYAYGLWSGDIPTGFPAMSDQRLFMLSSVTLGVSWWGMDIGGFSGTPTPENYYRWIQFGAFVPMFRVHGSYGLEREPWYFGAEAETIAAKFIRLRYALLPYIYSAAWDNHLTGVPLARPLVLEYPDDPDAANLTSEWMFGASLLVSPVTTAGASEQNVYIPEGTWYDFNSGKSYSGHAWYTVSIRADEMPIFVKGGAIIPMSQNSPYTDAPEMQRLIVLSSYPGGSGECAVRDDDGITYGYEDGHCSSVLVQQQRSETQAVVAIAPPSGLYLSPPRDWLVQLKWAGVPPDSVVLDGVHLSELEAERLWSQSERGWSIDGNSGDCSVRFGDDKAGHHLVVYFTRTPAGNPEHGEVLPRESRLEQNYPNPFNPATKIWYSVGVVSRESRVATRVRLAVYDLLGREVAVLMEEKREPGTYQLTFDGAKLASGVYFCRMTAGQYVGSRKLVLAK